MRRARHVGAKRFGDPVFLLDLRDRFLGARDLGIRAEDLGADAEIAKRIAVALPLPMPGPREPAPVTIATLSLKRPAI